MEEAGIKLDTRILLSGFAGLWLFFLIFPFIYPPAPNSLYSFLLANLVFATTLIIAVKTNLPKLLKIEIIALNLIIAAIIIYQGSSFDDPLKNLIAPYMAAIGIFILFLSAFYAINIRIFILAAALFSYSLIAPFISMIETQVGSFREILLAHWFSAGSIFSYPLLTACGVLILFVIFAKLYAGTGADNYFHNLFLKIFPDPRHYDIAAAIPKRLLIGPAAGYFSKSGEDRQKSLSLATIISEMTPPILGAGFFIAAHSSYLEIIKETAALAFIIFITGFYNHFFRSGLNRRDLFCNLQKALPLLLIIAAFGGSAFVAVSYINFSRLGFIAAALIAYAILFIADKKLPDNFRGLFNLAPPLFFLIGIFKFQAAPGALYSIIFILIIFAAKPLLGFFFAEQKSLTANYRLTANLFIKLIDSTALELAVFVTGMALVGLIAGALSISGLASSITFNISETAGNNLSLAIVFAIILSFLFNLIIDNFITCLVISLLLFSPLISDIAAQNSFDLPLLTINIFLLLINLAFSSALPAARLRFRDITGVKSFIIGIPADNLRYIIVFNLLGIMAILDQRLLFKNYSFVNSLLAFLSVVLGLVILLSVLKGRFITKNSRRQSFVLILIGLTFLYPKAWMNLAVPPYKTYSGDKIFEVAETLKSGDKIRLMAQGLDEIGESQDYIFLLKLGEGDSGEKRLESSGLFVRTRKGFGEITKIAAGSAAENIGLDPEFIIKEIGTHQEQPDKNWPLIPAILLLLIIAALQYRERKKFIAPA